MSSDQAKKLFYGVIPVILFGIAISYFLWYRIFEYPPHRYNLDFNTAQWISTGNKTPNGYFIKEIFIPDDVADAWIAIAATDNFTLFVNKEKISTDTFESLNVSGIYDVTGMIRSGKNIIAVSVGRRSYPGYPRILLKGVYRDLIGKNHVFVTDNTWKVSSVEERQGIGNIHPWHSEKFDHTEWGKAKIEGPATAYSIYTSETAPYILNEPLSGYWVQHPEPKVKSAYFIKSFRLESPARDAIIGIAGISTYDITVNGITVKKDSAFQNNLDIYNITPLMHSGKNTIGIGVKALDTIPALFFEGYIRDRTSVINLKSDSTWKTIANITVEEHIPDINSSEWKTPLLFAKYPSEPWGILSKKMKDIDLPSSFTTQRLLKFCSFTLGIIAILLCIWFSIASFHAKIKKNNLLSSLLLDGVFHIPSLLFMFLIYILKFDVRHDTSFPFQFKFILISLLILFFLRIIEFANIPIKNWRPKFLEIKNKKMLNLFFLILLVCLTATGFLIRTHELDYASLSHDEVTIMQYTDGLLTRGSLSKEVGTYIKPMTTYELLPFSVSLPVILFGFNDFAARLHSVFWGTFEILLIFILGKTLFNRSAGFVAAAIYTFHPWCISWGQNVTYPQLTQAIATLTALFFYKAIDSNSMNKRYLYITAITFSFMYLSWEGSGFLLIAMFVAILAHKGSDLLWLKNKHLWTGFAIIFLTVLIQQSRRILNMNPYLVIGTRVADVSLPSLVFLDPMFNPYFYIDRFFFMENNWMLTILLIAGIPLLFKHRPLRYLYIMLLSVVFFLTNFFPLYSIRYTYYLEPFLILIACAVIFIYFDAFRGLFSGSIIRSFISLTAIAMSLVVFITSNDIFINLYQLSKDPYNPAINVRQNIYWNDYKSPNLYVKDHLREGDIIFAAMPHTLEYYTGDKGNYNLTTLLARNGMNFDTGGSYPGLLDKYIGNPIIIDIDEFRRIIGKNNRIWFISAPHTALDKDNDEEAIDYITQNFKVVYESYNSKVYLWEK